MNDFRYGFTRQEKDGVQYFTIPSFVQAGGVRCAFSTRIGGVSPQPYDTLNFSRKREQNEANFQENMRRFSAAVGFDHTTAVSIHYAHSPLLYRAELKDAGCGIVREGLADFCDGLYTDAEQLPILSFHADCVPLFFYDPDACVIAMCHAGWRGTSQHMARNAVEALVSIGARPGNILAAVGPCISVSHYEVGPEVAEVFLHEFGENAVLRQDGSFYANLEAACSLDMLQSGIAAEHITLSGLCTYENAGLFYSHRRDKGLTGAMAAVLELI